VDGVLALLFFGVDGGLLGNRLFGVEGMLLVFVDPFCLLFFALPVADAPGVYECVGKLTVSIFWDFHFWVHMGLTGFDGLGYYKEIFM
jgi:hypothetical protein